MILIIDFGSSKVPDIENCIDEFDDFKTVHYLDFEEKLLDNAAGVILSGAPVLITEQDIAEQLEKTLWLKNTVLPVLGICFGHQIMGIHFGAFGTRIREDRDWQEIEVIKESPLFDKLPTVFEMLEDHCETISIPTDFDLIAISDVCINEAMQHKTKPLFGVQFHPETSGTFGRTVFENFFKIVNTK
ncbi:MAG: gamma-glutamyl-gamma-aminobutyrate hydrolase family protein [Bacteroidota bacterium]